jgi:hypothetical protein
MTGKNDKNKDDIAKQVAQGIQRQKVAQNRAGSLAGIIVLVGLILAAICLFRFGSTVAIIVLVLMIVAVLGIRVKL